MRKQRPSTAKVSSSTKKRKAKLGAAHKVKSDPEIVEETIEEEDNNNELINENKSEEINIIEQYADATWLNMDIRYERLSSLYDRQKHQYLKGITVGPDVRCLSIVNSKLWEATRGGGIHIRHFETGDIIKEIKHTQLSSQDADKFFITAIYPFEKLVWAGTSDGWLFCFDNSGKNRIHQMNEHNGGVRCLHGDEEFVWSGSEDFTILQRYGNSGKFVKKLTGHSAWLNDLAIDPLYGWLWSAADDGICVWDPAPPEEEDEEENKVSSPDNNDNDEENDLVDNLMSGTAVLSLCVVGKHIWCGLKDGKIVVYNASNRERLIKFKAHSQGVHTICLVNNDIWSASFDKHVNCWNVDTFDKMDSIALDAEETPMGRLITKGHLRVADMVFGKGKVWLGCRSKGSLHSFRVFHPYQSKRINIRMKRPPTPPPKPKPKVEKKKPKPKDDDEEPEIDLLKLSLQELVNLWNGKQGDPYLRLNRKPEDPLNRKEGVFRIGNRKLRLVAMDGTIMVRVGGGYVTIDEFINNNASHFRTLARIAMLKEKKNANKSTDTTTTAAITTTTTTTMQRPATAHASSKTSTPSKRPSTSAVSSSKRPSTASVTSSRGSINRNKKTSTRHTPSNKPSSSRPASRRTSTNNNNNNNTPNKPLGHGQVSNTSNNSAVDVSVLTGKRAFSARRRNQGASSNDEEIVVDVGKVVETEQELKKERRFINRLLRAMMNKRAADFLKYIDEHDKELSKQIKERTLRLKNNKK